MMRSLSMCGPLLVAPQILSRGGVSPLALYAVAGFQPPFVLDFVRDAYVLPNKYAVAGFNPPLVLDFVMNTYLANPA